MVICTLNVVVEREISVAEFLQQSKRVVVGKVLELN